MMVPDPVVRKYSFSDLPVKVEWLEKLLGYPEGEIPEAIRDVISEIIEKAPDYADIQGGYVIPEDFEVLDNNNFRVNGLDFNSGKIITGSLRKSERLAFFLMTAGSGIENWSRELMSGNDPLGGYIVDLLGSEIVEAGMDHMQGELEREMEKQDLRISNRYSPGHCGWLVDEQQKLFSFFPGNFCGVSLTDSSLMLPIKSVSGIIGIGKDIKKKAYSCQVCDVEDCLYRDRKTVV
jgi:hypothetical protein